MEKSILTFPIHIEVPSQKGPVTLTFETYLDFKRNWERYTGWKNEIESYFTSRGFDMYRLLNFGNQVYNIITGEPAPLKREPRLHSCYYEEQHRMAEAQKLK